MNTNELAEQLDEYVGNNGYSHNDYADSMSQASTMLRQLQADLEHMWMANTVLEAEIEALKARLNPYQSITDTKIEPTVVSYTHPAKEHFEDEPQAEELHEIMQSNAELTDEEIHQAIRRGFSREGFLSDGIFLEIKELLRNTQGVNSEQVPDFFFMENDLMGKR